MGVLRLFRWLVLKHPDCLIRLHVKRDQTGKIKDKYKLCETAKSKGINIDWVEYDLNSIFHPVAAELHSVKPPVISLRHKRKPLPPVPEKPEHVIFSKICERLEDMRTILSPSKGLCFAVDGTAGVSKCAQQKKRRFKTASDKNKNTEGQKTDWDSTKISCGTAWMERLNNHIDLFIQDQLKSNSLWHNFEVLFSSHRVHGEGEHAVLKHMKQNPNLSYGVISPDADVIFLAAGLHNPNIYIFRENIFDDIDGEFFLVHIGRFRECIIAEIGMGHETDQSKLNRCIEDFILYLFSVGNDFLPPITSLNIANDGIEALFHAYKRMITTSGFMSERLTNGQYQLRKEGMKGFMRELAVKEDEMLVYNYLNNKARKADSLMTKHISLDSKAESDNLIANDITFNFEAYKKDYYALKFHGVDPKIVAHEYLKGMTFVLRYYLDSIPSWSWSYPFMYAPLFSELSQHLESFDFTFSFPSSVPFSPFEQLLAILPSQSAYLLPEPLQPLLTSPDSPIADFYPIDFEVDLEGKKNEYEGIILLPHVDPERISKAFESVKDSLNEEDKERNKSGSIFAYKLDHDHVIKAAIGPSRSL
jgi:5'-3' exoribonuclease 1